MDPTVQQLLANQAAQKQNENSTGVGFSMPWPFNVLFHNGMPQNDLSPSTLASWLGNSLMPKWSGLFNIGGRVLAILAFKGSKPWQIGQHAPNYSFMANGFQGPFAQEFFKMDFSMNEAVAPRGFGSAQYVTHSGESMPATSIMQHNGGAEMVAG